LKAVLDHLGSKYEVHEDLLDLYFTLSSAKPIEDGHMRNVIHKSWTLKVGDGQEDRVVTIRMADQLDSVGLTSWQAGFMLADFISANPKLFDDKKCLELGSGVGLTGIVLAKAARPSRLCLTDYTQEVLTNMRTNASINDLQDIDIQQLDWEQFETNSEANSSLLPFLPDVILAADCVYDIGLIEKLCLVLKWCLERTESVQHPVAYIATTLRNPKTFQFFIDQLEKNKLDHEDVSATSKFDDLFGQPHTGIILSRITSRKLQ
jgi:predicted nicotinamide N-methyase